MNRIVPFFKKWQNVLKGLLFLSILVLVLMELSRMGKTISPAAVGQILRRLSFLQVASLFLCGLLSVSPMMLYDYVLTKELQKQIRPGKLIENSWTINSLNNLIGFAGLVDVGLRYSYFSEKDREGETMKGISRVIPYFMSGLSVYSFLSLFLVIFAPGNRVLYPYLIVLLLASLILPALLFVSSRKKISFFGNLHAHRVRALICASLLDWGCVTLFFFSIGRILGYPVSILNIAPLFLISICIGMVSMIPGSLGSFDLMMISGLLHFSINQNEAASWLLLFRIFYYIIPFFIGLIFFLKSMGKQINDKFQGLPKKMAALLGQSSSHFMTNFFGFFLMATSILPSEIHSLPLLGRMDPIKGQLLYQYPCFLFGSLFFLLGRMIRRKAAFAKPFSLILCLLTLFYINLDGISLFSSLYLLFLLLLLYLQRKTLCRTHFFYSPEDRLKDFGYIAGSFLLTLFLLYLSGGAGGKESLGFLLFHENFTVSAQSMQRPHYFASFLENFVHAFLYLLLPFLCYAAAVFLAGKRHLSFGEPFQKERFDDCLQGFTNPNPDASLAYLGDKLLYYYREDGIDRTAFQFALEDGRAVVMGDPIGDPDFWPFALADFLRRAEEQNLIPLFYEAGEEVTLLLHNYGYEFMKFGESAKVDLSTFTLTGKSGRKFRAAVNKVENKGYSFTVKEPPFSDAFMDDLEHISSSWLGDRQEKGFSLGFFDRDYLRLSPIACVLDAEGRVQAFSNFLVCNSEVDSSVDLMRYNPETESNGIMDYLFVQMFLYLKDKGVKAFDLGMAPLSRVGMEEHSFFQEKIAYLVYAFTNRFYSFSGLRNYKEKFAPVWEPRFLSYPKDSSLLFDLLTIYKIDNRKVKTLTERKTV